MDETKVIESIQCWLSELVIGQNLCPFAKREYDNGRVRFVVSKATDQQQLLQHLGEEILKLDEDASIETTLLIHPRVLQDFFQFNDFLDYADRLLTDMDRDGVYQVASFHPDYQFAGTDVDDVTNYTNRSPWPVLHLIREDSLEQALANYPNPEQIPQRNMEHMEKLGLDAVRALLQACMDH